MSFKLYELSEAFNSVAVMIEEGTEGLEPILEGIEGTFSEKVESIIKLMKSKAAERDAIDEERNRLAERAQRLDKQVQWLFDYVESQMKLTGIEEVKSPLFTIKLGKNPAKVEVNDLALVPDKFIRTKLTTIPDKHAIKDALQAGEEVPGCELVRDTVLKVR
jgi:Siphovirus Gp157.